mgnify:CR=1 FL=1
MKYFENFVMMPYTFDPKRINFFSVRNIFTRVKMLDSIISNINVYYTYNMKDSDNVENIAYKYYGDVNRYWIIAFANTLIDPLFNIPLKYQPFIDYIVKKYSLPGDTSDEDALTRASSTVEHYEKRIIKTCSAANGFYSSNTTTSYYANTTYSIDGISATSSPYALPNVGDDPLILSTSTSTLGNFTVTSTIELVAVSCYDTEYQNNENKRTLKLIKKEYAPQIEQELRKALTTP